ncbi:MAG: tetratricopeptide repeat protein, partial [bacterium]
AQSSVGDSDGARATFGRVLAAHPDFLRSWNALAAMEARLGRYDDALKALDRARAIGPRDYETLTNFGFVYGEMDRLTESAEEFRKACESKPASAEARNNLGRALLRLKRPDEAEAALQEARRLDPKLATPIFNLGLIEEERKHLAAAEARYREALAADPGLAEGWFRLGNLALARSQEPGHESDTAWSESGVRQAVESYGRAVAVNPVYNEARYNLALTLMQLRRLDEAAKHVRILIANDPKSPGGQFLLGTVEAQRGRAEAAEKAYRTALKLDPKHLECRLRLASLQFQTGKAAAAAASYREVLKQDESNVEAHYLLGLVLFRQGELIPARKELERTLELKPDHLDAMNNAANICLRMRNIKDASAFVGRAVDADPAYLPIFRTAELVYAQSGGVEVTGSPRAVGILTHYLVGFRNFARDPAASEKAFRAIIAAEPRCAAGRLKLGVLLVITKREREGIAELEEARKLVPADSEIAYAIATGYYGLGEKDPRGEKSPWYEEAAGAYRRAVEISPQYAEAWWGLGSALYKMGRFKEARAQLEACLKLNPFFAEAYNTLGSVAARQAAVAPDASRRASLLAEAERAFTQALRANPNSETAHYNLGTVFHEGKKYKEALEEYEAALRLNPKMGLALYRLSRLYADRKAWFDRGRAEETFTKLLALEPGNCEFQYDFGAFYFNSRQYDKAKVQWTKTLSLCPDAQNAKDGLTRLAERGY